MSKVARTVRVSSWEDLVLMVVQMPVPIVHCAKRGKRFVYFTYFELLPRVLLVYYLTSDEKVTQRFVVYNRIRNTIRFSDELSTEPNLLHIPIISVEKEDILPGDLP
ncbi:TPA: hypothetical protein EYP44_02895 [Candidatus Bathyarchaeota archaeon]|nr:hypothetical protein [Candidatus Bathyarchaeota archaeon]